MRSPRIIRVIPSTRSAAGCRPAIATPALIIPAVGSNRDRHPRLQRFMLANDSTTIAVEVPIWLFEQDIAALEAKYRLTIIPREPIDPARPEAGHRPRHITGHID